MLTKLDRPINPEETPAIMVYANDARRGDQDYGNSVVPRVVKVTIEAAVNATPETALDLADALTDAIEAAVEANPTLSNKVQDARWQRTMTDVTSMGQHTIGVCLLQYEVDMLTENRLADPFPGDGFDGVPVVVFSVPDTTAPTLRGEIKPDPDLECGPDGCAPSAWGGEVKHNGEPIV